MTVDFDILKQNELKAAVELAGKAYEDYEYFTNYFPDLEERRKVLRGIVYREFLTNFKKTHYLVAKRNGELVAVVQLNAPDYKKPSDFQYLVHGWPLVYLGVNTYEPPYVEKTRKTPQQKLHANVFYGADHQEEIVLSLLSKYLSKRELTYYMAAINREARQCRDCYTQVIQVILEKEKQPKFSKAKKQYKRNNIIEYALQENLKEYGWSIEPPKNYKQVYKQEELFR